MRGDVPGGQVASCSGRGCLQPVRVAQRCGWRRARGVARCAAASQQPSETGAGDAQPGIEFSYRSADGHAKFTFEQAFNENSKSVEDAPWQFLWQQNEKVLVWSDDLKGRLVKRLAGQELGLTDEQVEARLRELAVILPDLSSKLSVIKPALLARMCADTGGIARALLELREIFPRADVGLMALRCPGLVLGDVPLATVATAAQRLRELLPRSEVDKLVQEHPLTMLDVDGFADALDKAATMIPGLDVEKKLASDPTFIFGFQRGSRLIPYDQFEGKGFDWGSA